MTKKAIFLVFATISLSPSLLKSAVNVLKRKKIKYEIFFQIAEKEEKIGSINSVTKLKETIYIKNIYTKT